MPFAMTVEDVIGHYGNANKAAKKLGFTRQAFTNWKRKGIPFESQYRIQLKTRGKLRADTSMLDKP